MPHLDTFSGNWTTTEARHLLRRTSFGITETLVNTSVSLGLNETINTLFKENPLPDPPVKYKLDGTGDDQINDPGAKFGETWVNSPAYPVATDSAERTRIYRSRNRSLYAWSFLQMQNSGISIREKLTLFWHNHFVSENSNPHREYYYMNVLRTNALKNFKELTKQVTVDTNMLLYLSGSQNTDAAPNENYSRELLELFTIGKGDAVGNGDYTNYTEDDVVQIAKALTGGRIKGLNNVDALTSFFSNNKHTKGDKTLSHRFNNAVISENGENEYKDVIDKIFEQDECSRFITRKLYIWFINDNITAETETNIIEPLAKIIRDNNYDIAPALKKLLASDHFFENIFCMMKNPIDLIFSSTQSLGYSAPTISVNLEYEYALILYSACTDLNQSIFHHPDVSGWKAYYQAPLFYKSWVNNYLLPKRLEYCKIIVTGGKVKINGKNYTLPPLTPVLQVAANITNSQDPDILINSLATQLFNYPINESQLTALKGVLIPGLPNFEWTVEYNNFLANPSDEGLKTSIENKLRNLISTMVQMSEFQIM
ncbi:uncharacterized protein DUF1800 [Lutibacter sp. Hel_I_33_5]|uniref:DUF1800 domain-containing protein n=1 Tax=Lutibacter sp. Hel_I_33_5 TaxID=1566289 RepID=UPI0011A4CF74|nr:DUF1800 family protein [Lutibacter sp. Hel_I_33_5]TVZ56023.1 uncharacterized protein DUF1800 [Lutibacter sp. Hel_I_33_5]